MEEVPVERAHDQFDVNVHGPHRPIRAALPHMRERGDGTVVTVSSTGGRVAVPGFGVYCATKHAVEGLCDVLRTEVAPFGVDVVLVEPGFTRTGYYGTAERTRGSSCSPGGSPTAPSARNVPNRRLRAVRVPIET